MFKYCGTATDLAGAAVANGWSPALDFDPRHLFEVKVVAVEVPDRRQILPVFDLHRTLRSLNQSVLFQCHQGPVYVDGREAKGVGQLILSHRKLIVALPSEPRGLEPQRELA